MEMEIFEKINPLTSPRPQAKIPLRFVDMTQQLKRRLTSLDLKSATKVLGPGFAGLSPSVGLLTLSSKQRIANLLSRPNPKEGELCKELFHQRTYESESKYYGNGRVRYGPVEVTKSRSKAAYWITPSALGCLTGLVHIHGDKAKDSVIDAALAEHGITTNHINDVWTGVSMARYRKIAKLLAESRHKHTSGIDPDALSIAMTFLWEKAASKRCLLDFYLAVEKASGLPILKDAYAQLRVDGSTEQQKWLSDQFQPAELNAEAVWRATALYQQHHSTLTDPNKKRVTANVHPDLTEEAVSDAIDTIAASYALERSFKPPIKLGRYSYQDGRARPDCVEVVVREVIDFLIFDPTANRFCPERLPPNTLPAVKTFYDDLAVGKIDDVSTIPRGSNATRGRSARNSENRQDKTTNVNTAAGVDKGSGGSSYRGGSTVVDGGVDSTSQSKIDAAGAPATGGGESGGAVQYWEATTAGAAWFNLCSALPGAEYLCQTPTKQLPYELQPTMRNVSATLGILLGWQEGSGTLRAMKDIEKFWNAHQEQQIQGTKSHTLQKIDTTEGVVRFRAPFSDTEMITREVSTIKFQQGRHAIELELESAHQLATVKHKLFTDAASQVWTTEVVAAFTRLYEDHIAVVLDTLCSEETAERSVQICCDSILTAVLGDVKLNILLTALRARAYTTHTTSSAPPQRAQKALGLLIEDAVLASRWGEEQRTGANLSHTAPGAVLSITDASLTTAKANAQREASVESTLQALEVITHCSDDKQLCGLVRWMLEESPSEESAEQVATVLLRLPTAVRGGEAFQKLLGQLAEKGTTEGRLLCSMLRFGTRHCPSKSWFQWQWKNPNGATVKSSESRDKFPLGERVRLLTMYLRQKFLM